MGFSSSIYIGAALRIEGESLDRFELSEACDEQLVCWGHSPGATIMVPNTRITRAAAHKGDCDRFTRFGVEITAEVMGDCFTGFNEEFGDRIRAIEMFPGVTSVSLVFVACAESS